MFLAYFYCFYSILTYADEIDKKTYEIKQDDEAGVVESLEKLEEELPDNSPRYVVVSYPVTLPDGRKSNPYVMLYYLPPNSSQNERMLYAQATELFKSRANVSRMIEIKESEDFEDIPKILSS